MIRVRHLIVACLAVFLAAIAAPVMANDAPAGLSWQGDFSQGGMVHGRAPPGSRLLLGQRAVPVGRGGEFVFGFNRDEAAQVKFQADLPDGRQIAITLQVKKQSYDIQRIDNLPQAQVTPPPSVLERIRQENAKIAALRQRDTPRLDFLTGWIWPADGPVSGVYGSQRILNGEPRQPHFGLDIAAPVGAVVRASTDGEVIMAEPDLYFTGGTILLDHGHGITGAYSHLSKISVQVGQRVKQGEEIGRVGATGRATGPHLDWRVNWFDVRLDPQRLLPPR